MFSSPSFSNTPVEPSWTGPKPPVSTGKKRFQRWVCDEQNVCKAYEEDEFTDNINWRIFRIMAEFVEGFEFLSKLKREVTFFGSARAVVGSRSYEDARQLGFLLGKEGYTVVTGGGPGIMEAGNWGAYEAGGESVGLDIALPMEQRRNQYVKRGMGFNYFFTRKVMLSASAQAYVFFPGGFGTMDELFEMATLIQTNKMSRKVPIVLVGKAFWTPLIEWMREHMWQEDRYIEKEDLQILQVVDTAEEAYQIITQTEERRL
ncbi:MAG: hypothetical protein QG668_662 [Patescibacteria group bacterium]|jgi:uncharacterized protein (TIGR00730 family)|nr:hypothetical protein [Patescibacteria group bacterium]